MQSHAAVIGQGWLSASDKHGAKRLWDAKDFVRIEIVAALKRNISVVPVLVDGATMPTLAELPYELEDFTRRNAVTITHENFATDVAKLARKLEPALTKSLSLRSILSNMLGFFAIPRSPPQKSTPMNSDSVPSVALIGTFFDEAVGQKPGSVL